MWDLLFLESSKNWLPCFSKSYQLESTIGLSGLATKAQNAHLSLNFRWYTHFFKIFFLVGIQSSGFHYIVYMPMYHYTLFSFQLYYYRCVCLCLYVCDVCECGYTCPTACTLKSGHRFGDSLLFPAWIGWPGFTASLHPLSHRTAPAPLYFSSCLSSYRWPLPQPLSR